MKFKIVFVSSVVLVISNYSVLAASPWPADGTATANIASNLTTYNNTADGFEASGVEYLSDYGYIVNGDDGDLAVLSSAGEVLEYWLPTGDLEGVTVTDTSSTNNKIYLANESGSIIEEFDLATGTKTGLAWTLSDLLVSGGAGFEALAYVPATDAPAVWGTAQSGGFFIAGSQAEAQLRVYTFDLSSSATVSSLTQISVTYTDVSALYYDSLTKIVYVVFDGSNEMQEYNLTGSLIESYTLPTTGSEEGIVLIPNCSANLAQIVITNDAVSSTTSVYGNYPISCPVTTVDADQDGVVSTSDCNDNDATVASYLTVYQDYDGDGLGNPAVSQEVCATTAPTGYVTDNTDTDDSGVIPEPEPTYSPVEYLSNGIDDDGDGKIDEWNTLESNGVHPDADTISVTSFAGATNGAIKVRYDDGSGYRYTVFSTSTTKLTKVSWYQQTSKLFIKLGRRRAKVNPLTGKVLRRSTISKK